MAIKGSEARCTLQASLPSQIWTPPEIDFFDVSGDLEQKKKCVFFFVHKNFLDLENFSILFFFFRKCQETALQG